MALDSVASTVSAQLAAIRQRSDSSNCRRSRSGWQLGAVCGMSAVTGKLCVVHRDGSDPTWPTSSSPHAAAQAVLEEVLWAAAQRLSDFLGPCVPKAWDDGVDAMLEEGWSQRELFGGEAVVPWAVFQRAVSERLGIKEKDMAAFCVHGERVGAVMVQYERVGIGVRRDADEAGGVNTESTAASEVRVVVRAVGGTARADSPSPPPPAAGAGCGIGFAAPPDRAAAAWTSSGGGDTPGSTRVSLGGPGAGAAAGAGSGAGAAAAAADVAASSARSQSPRPSRRGTVRVPVSVLVTPQLLVLATKVVMSHMYVGVYRHSERAQRHLDRRLSGEALSADERHVIDEVVAEQLMMQRVEADAIADVPGYSKELVEEDEAAYLDRGHVRRRFLEHVLWGRRRRVMGSAAFVSGAWSCGWWMLL